jgi:hypothetical protein
MTSAKIKGGGSSSANSKSAKNNANIQGARKFKEREKSRSAKARMQKREIKGPKKSWKAPARRVLPGSAKEQARRLDKSARPALVVCGITFSRFRCEMSRWAT